MKPFCIYNGTKIMYMEVEGVRFIDSLNFIAAPLSTFPKTFDLTELKKGYPYQRKSMGMIWQNMGHI